MSSGMDASGQPASCSPLATDSLSSLSPYLIPPRPPFSSTHLLPPSPLQRDTVLMPCGHLVCRSCSSRLERCPMCRADVTGRNRAFV